MTLQLRALEGLPRKKKKMGERATGGGDSRSKKEWKAEKAEKKKDSMRRSQPGCTANCQRGMRL